MAEKERITTNYYTLIRRADKLIRAGIEILKQNPNGSISFLGMICQFQREFGFNKKRLLKLLEPYIEAGVLKIENDEVRLVSEKEFMQSIEVKENGNNNRLDGQPTSSNASPQSEPELGSD